MPHSDNKYIEGIRDNNEQLLKEIYLNFFGRIKAMILANGGNENDASDIFQEALLAVFRQTKHSSFTLECPLEAYLYIICKNRWISFRQSVYGSRVTFTDTFSSVIEQTLVDEAEQLGMQAGRHSLLKKKILQLEDGCRKILELSWNGIPLQKVAELLGTTYAYVRKRKTVCTGKLIESVRQSPEFAFLKW